MELRLLTFDFDCLRTKDPCPFVPFSRDQFDRHFSRGSKFFNDSGRTCERGGGWVEKEGEASKEFALETTQSIDDRIFFRENWIARDRGPISKFFNEFFTKDVRRSGRKGGDLKDIFALKATCAGN